VPTTRCDRTSAPTSSTQLASQGSAEAATFISIHFIRPRQRSNACLFPFRTKYLGKPIKRSMAALGGDAMNGSMNVAASALP